MLLQVLTERPAQDPHARSMHDADARQTGEERLLDKARYLFFRLVGGAADDINLRRQVVGVGGGLDGDRLRGGGRLRVG